jgi:NADH:ubiquinone oxidoreductase subunit 5 (subunit L)/multisubunit Na+/H+ antiporter MnhA subunit
MEELLREFFICVAWHEYLNQWIFSIISLASIVVASLSLVFSFFLMFPSFLEEDKNKKMRERKIKLSICLFGLFLFYLTVFMVIFISHFKYSNYYVGQANNWKITVHKTENFLLLNPGYPSIKTELNTLVKKTIKSKRPRRLQERLNSYRKLITMKQERKLLNKRLGELKKQIESLEKEIL